MGTLSLMTGSSGSSRRSASREMAVRPRVSTSQTTAGGTGPPRKCARKKELEGCWQCAEFETCPKLEFLEANHGDAHLRNLRALKRKGPAAFLKGRHYWFAPPRKSQNTTASSL